MILLWKNSIAKNALISSFSFYFIFARSVLRLMWKKDTCQSIGISNIFCGFCCIVVECKQCKWVRAVCAFVIFMLPVIKLRTVQLWRTCWCWCWIDCVLLRHTHSMHNAYLPCRKGKHSLIVDLNACKMWHTWTYRNNTKQHMVNVRSTLVWYKCNAKHSNCEISKHEEGDNRQTITKTIAKNETVP